MLDAPGRQTGKPGWADVCWTRIPISCSTNHQSKCANWEPAAAGPTAASSAPAAPCWRHCRKPRRHPGCHSKRPPKPSTVWTSSFRGFAARKGNSPGIGSGCPRPLRQRINTSDARGDQTRTSAWIPATTARRVWWWSSGIEWLMRKPGAFENYRYQEDLFPTSRFRMAYDALKETTPTRTMSAVECSRLSLCSWAR